MRNHDVITLAGHSNFATTHVFYLTVNTNLVDRARHAIVHIGLADKAKAIKKMPRPRTLKLQEVKTGTMDTPDKCTGDLTENPVKIYKNPATSSKEAIVNRKVSFL